MSNVFIEFASLLFRRSGRTRGVGLVLYGFFMRVPGIFARH
jgi:hypothetical protein